MALNTKTNTLYEPLNKNKILPITGETNASELSKSSTKISTDKKLATRQRKRLVFQWTIKPVDLGNTENTIWLCAQQNINKQMFHMMAQLGTRFFGKLILNIYDVMFSIFYEFFNVHNREQLEAFVEETNGINADILRLINYAKDPAFLCEKVIKIKDTKKILNAFVFATEQDYNECTELMKQDRLADYRSFIWNSWVLVMLCHSHQKVLIGSIILYIVIRSMHIHKIATELVEKEGDNYNRFIRTSNQMFTDTTINVFQILLRDDMLESNLLLQRNLDMPLVSTQMDWKTKMIQERQKIVKVDKDAKEAKQEKQEKEEKGKQENKENEETEEIPATKGFCISQ